MSSKRKITVSSSSSTRRSRSSERNEDQGYHQQSQQLPPRQRPSVFSRLGTKRPGVPLAPGASGKSRGDMPIQCRNILETGICHFESKCKYAHTHKMALQTRAGIRSKLRGPTGHWIRFHEFFTLKCRLSLPYSTHSCQTPIRPYLGNALAFSTIETHGF